MTIAFTRKAAKNNSSTNDFHQARQSFHQKPSSYLLLHPVHEIGYSRKVDTLTVRFDRRGQSVQHLKPHFERSA